MLAPNGKISNLTDEQWRIVRTAEFKREFGDWEIVSIMNVIKEMIPITVEVKNYGEKEAFMLYKQLIPVKRDGFEIKFFKSSFKKIYKENGLFVLVVPYLSEILKASVLAYSEIDCKAGVFRPDGTMHKQHRNIAFYNNYIGKVSIGNRRYYVRFTVAVENVGLAGMHSCFVSNIELYEKSAAKLNSTFYPSEENASTPAPTRARLVFDRKVDTKLQDFFDMAKKFSAKIKGKVDSNGEPLPKYITE
ncbi:MAG: hypothetical protein IK025_04610 [Bacteroidales bacterium]|nr:hypothetical protein [Bacteroidales bacterium]